MAKTSKTRYAALGMLSIGAMSGYEIRQTMQQSTENFWSESDGQLYPTLATLTKQGLITCKTSETSGAREKKIYRITAKGTTELKKWLGQQAETQSIRSEFMLKLFFGANVTPAINLEHVQAQRYQIKDALLRLEETKKHLAKEYKNSPHLPYWLISVAQGIKVNEAKLIWCDETINTLEKMKAKR